MHICPPIFTVLSDHASEFLENADEAADIFALRQRLAPIFDIVRHKETAAPLCMAICGQAGTGKTTALKWIQGKLEEWNQLSVAERAGHPRVIPVWFSLCDFTDPDRVLYRIVSRLLCRALEQIDPVKDGMLLTRAAELCSFLPDGVAAGELSRLIADKGGRGSGSGSELQEGCSSHFGDLNLEDYARFVDVCMERCSEKGDPVRLAVLIDDVDHICPPVMLVVLNLMAVRYRSRHTVFIAGLDPAIAQKLIIRHFKAHEFSEQQGRHYLSKVFQVECHIEPDEEQVRRFFRRQRDLLDLRTGSVVCGSIPDEYKDYIETAVLHLASRNPRKVNLLLNSALLKAVAAVGPQHEEASGVHYAQSIQLYLLQRWFSYFSVGASALLRTDVQQWLKRLSAEAVKPTVRFDDLVKGRLGKEDSAGINRRLWDRGAELSAEEGNPFEPPEGLSLSMIHEWVWNLLKIPFDPDRDSCMGQLERSESDQAELTVAGAAAELLGSASASLRDIFAAACEKSSLDLHDEDLRGIRELEVDGQHDPPSDFEVIGRMDWLERIDLHNSNVQDLAWISRLQNLKTLNLASTSICDLTPLSSLCSLERLDLTFTQVTDLSPLSCIKNLEVLVLYGTDVKDLGALKGLQHLERLNLSYTKVEIGDLASVKDLPALRYLFLRGTAVDPAAAAELSRNSLLHLKVEI